MKYLDPDGLDISQFQGREEEGILFVEKAGETLFIPDEEMETRT